MINKVVHLFSSLNLNTKVLFLFIVNSFNQIIKLMYFLLNDKKIDNL